VGSATCPRHRRRRPARPRRKLRHCAVRHSFAISSPSSCWSRSWSCGPRMFAGSARRHPSDDRNFIAPSKPFNVPGRCWSRWRSRGAAPSRPAESLCPADPHQLLALCPARPQPHLGRGHVGLVSLGHAALLAIALCLGAAFHRSRMRHLVHPPRRRHHGGVGTILVFPSFRCAPLSAIATLAIGEIVGRFSSLGKPDARPIGISGIPSLSLFGFELESNQSVTGSRWGRVRQWYSPCPSRRS